MADHTVRCWGADNWGQLGDGGGPDRVDPVTVPGVQNVVELASLATGNGIDRPSNAEEWCALRMDGTVMCWGVPYNWSEGPSTQGIVSPTTQPGSTGIVNLSARCGIQADGSGCGPVAFTQIGAGVLPIAVCGTLADHSVVCTGTDSDGNTGVPGQVGQNMANNTTPVVGISTAVQAMSNGFVSCATLQDTSVRCWGADSYGMLGNGTVNPWHGAAQPTPSTVLGVTGATHVDVGYLFACSLINDGSVRCWGYGVDGVLGDGASVARATAEPVDGIAGATQVSAGGFHACALVTGGQVQCWGDPLDGRTGVKATFPRPQTVVVG
jgi:alpha-tubulin suppressor-like RCC1 family protein